MFASIVYSFLSTFYYKQTPVSENYFDILHNTTVFRHTANTPIATLLCNLEFLKTKLQDKNSQEIINSCYLASLRLKNLINPNYREENKKNYKEKIYIKKTLDNIKILLDQGFSNLKVDLNLDIDSNCYLTGSQLLFEEVIICLVNNACEAYEKKQNKIINLTVKKEKDPQTHNIILVIYITDYACGMNYLEQKLATLPKYTHKKKNSGIGLHFVKTTIEKYFGGELYIFSQKGFGTQVCLKIPFRRK